MNNEMTYQIEYLPSALQDLKEIAYYTGFKLQNPEAAETCPKKLFRPWRNSLKSRTDTRCIIQ